MRRMVLGSLGLVLFLSGMVVFPLPIPFGLLMMAVGLRSITKSIKAWVSGSEAGPEPDVIGL